MASKNQNQAIALMAGIAANVISRRTRSGAGHWRASSARPSADAVSENRVWSHGSSAKAAPAAANLRSDKSRLLSIATTPTITRAAPRPSGYTVNAWKTNGADSATVAQPNQLA